MPKVIPGRCRLESDCGGYDEDVLALGGALDEGVEFGQDFRVASL